MKISAHDHQNLQSTVTVLGAWLEIAPMSIVLMSDILLPRDGRREHQTKPRLEVRLLESYAVVDAFVLYEAPYTQRAPGGQDTCKTLVRQDYTQRASGGQDTRHL